MFIQCQKFNLTICFFFFFSYICTGMIFSLSPIFHPHSLTHSFSSCFFYYIPGAKFWLAKGLANPSLRDISWKSWGDYPFFADAKEKKWAWEEKRGTSDRLFSLFLTPFNFFFNLETWIFLQEIFFFFFKLSRTRSYNYSRNITLTYLLIRVEWILYIKKILP